MIFRSIGNWRRRKRLRGAGLFQKKVFISVRPWVVTLFCISMAIAVAVQLRTITYAIAVASSLASLGVVLISRYQVANLRHEARRALVIMDDDDAPLEHEEAETKTPMRLIVNKDKTG